MHIYVHVPFCGRRCSYCDFAIAVRASTPDEQFVSAIVDEWHRRTIDLPLTPVSTLYFGGGTPSRLDPRSIARIVSAISLDAPLHSEAEVTLEANPDDVTQAKAAAWAAAGVNRVSLGVQSHHSDVLQWMHRTHRADQVAPAVEALREAGITNISLDLIFAVPAALQRDWRRDLEQTIDLSPSHISLYGLTVEPRTPLQRWADRGSVIPLSDDEYASQYLVAHEQLVGGGYEHYEVSNAALPGYRSRHNSVYWSGADYLGLGPSAHSLCRGVRQWNVREWVDFAERSVSGISTVGGEERLDLASGVLERRYLGLRTSDGLALDQIPAATVRSWQESGWALVADARICLTPEGWLRLDALVAGAPDS